MSGNILSAGPFKIETDTVVPPTYSPPGDGVINYK